MSDKATRIDLFSLRTPQMRAFHMTWLAFFLCFFAWFGVAPLMPVIRAELALTQAQIGNCVIASVAVTIFARLIIGWLCDRIGPRLAYTWLLVLGSLPVMGIGLAHSYQTFLLFRLAISVIGASFVITQYHTSVMFASNVVGTANATTAGWGNLGGGVVQMVMPMLFAGLVGLGVTKASSWRMTMFFAGLACLLAGIAYYRVTQDCPEGNYKDLRAAGRMPSIRKQTEGAFRAAITDRRVWALFILYGACFGVELTIDNVAALYFSDYFKLSLKTAGIVAALFGLMNIFGRTAGGYLGDVFARKGGLQARVKWLFACVLCEGIFLVVLSRMAVLPLAIAALVLFGLFVQMSCGATYSVVPFINKRALGPVSGIIGAGGNLGGMLAGFMFKGGLGWPSAFLVLGVIVVVCSGLALTVSFSPSTESDAVVNTGRLLDLQGNITASAA